MILICSSNLFKNKVYLIYFVNISTVHYLQSNLVSRVDIIIGYQSWKWLHLIKSCQLSHSEIFLSFSEQQYYFGYISNMTSYLSIIFIDTCTLDQFLHVIKLSFQPRLQKHKVHFDHSTLDFECVIYISSSYQTKSPTK